MRRVQISQDPDDEVIIEPLGSGREVGRSCVLVSYKGKKVMFDCGVHPGLKGHQSLPDFPDSCDDIDMVLVTHFHLDHCAGLPYLYERVGYKGPTFMTNVTKAFYRLVMRDFISVGTSTEEIATEEWVNNVMGKIETIDFHQEIVRNGIRVQPFFAGHVLGAAMFMIDIAGVKILYTGDFSRTADRHLRGAEIPPVSPDILIVESTYGTLELESREVREEKFLTWVKGVVLNGGRCLVPVFALGRAQELLLILEEEWERNEKLQRFKIYYASSMAERSMKQYQTYISDMNDLVQSKHEADINPFNFKFISPLKDAKSLVDDSPCVVLASPGMLQSGVSYDLFTRWCENPNNGVVIAGYCVEGTLAKKVLDKPSVIITDEGRQLRLKMNTIETVSFSAHSDGKQTKEFIAALQSTQHVVLVHGQEKPMEHLMGSLLQEFASRNLKVYNPRNREKVAIRHTTQRVAKVLGKLAAQSPAENEFVNGLMLVSGQHKYTVVHPSELSSFTGLESASIKQAMVIPLPVHKSVDEVLAVIRTYFESSEMFGGVKANAQGGVIHVAGTVSLSIEHDAKTSHTTVTTLWTTSRHDDFLADVTSIAVIQALAKGSSSDGESQMASLPVDLDASDKYFRNKCFHQMLAEFFPLVETNLMDGQAQIGFTLDGNFDVTVEQMIKIMCLNPSKPPSDDHLKTLSEVLKRVYLTLTPIPVDAGWCDCGKIHYGGEHIAA